jgi:hypothetical protein
MAIALNHDTFDKYSNLEYQKYSQVVHGLFAFRMQNRKNSQIPTELETRMGSGTIWVGARRASGQLAPTLCSQRRSRSIPPGISSSNGFSGTKH